MINRLTRLALPVILLLGACAAPSPAPLPMASVTIKDFQFQPADLTVVVGTTVTWRNTDSATHTVTAGDGSFDSGALSAQKTFPRRFDQVGTFAYHCNIHPDMTGTIHVLAH